MRHLLVIVVALLMTTAVSATDNPIDKGAWILTGNAYFMTQSGELYDNADGEGKAWLSFAPSVGYFIKPGFMIGVNADYTWESQGDNKTTYMLFGPTAGFYFHMDPKRVEPRGAVYPFIKGSFLYASDKFKADLFEETTKITQWVGEAGVVYMLSNAVGMNFQAKLISLKKDYDDDIVDPEIQDSESGNIFQLGAGITAFIY